MDITKSPNINYLWAELMIEELVRNGVENFCVSSGSRSSPLTLAVASNRQAKAHIHFDERGSAFRALGIISAIQKPCAVITTSGTAAANLYPAVIEASKKKAPMVLLTADRPPELRSTGAHQTIDQTKIYGNYVRWHFDLPCPTTDIAPAFVLTTIDQAVSRARGHFSGPVHINCMYREPLSPIRSKRSLTSYKKAISSWQKGNNVYTKYVTPKPNLKPSEADDLAARIRKVRSGVIVAGKLSGRKEQASVLKLAETLNWPIFADISSGLRLGSDHKNVSHYFDQILLSDKYTSSFKPDGILHLGGRITSKRWYEFVEDANPKQYIMALDHPLRNDPLHIVTTRVQCSIGHLADALVKRIAKRGINKHVTRLNKLDECAHQTIDQFFEQHVNLSEPHAARIISQNIPIHSGLFVSSSMPIREMDMVGDPKCKPVAFGSNRGASGIDGTIATAAGFTAGLNKPTTLLIGDLAFLHDINALAMLKDIEHPMVIVVFNNNGGGIFSFLPIQEFSEHFEKFFGTPHHLTFHASADLFDLNYCLAQTPDELVQSYKIALKARTSTIIEIQTDRAENLKIHDQIQSLIKNNINAALKPNRGKDHDKKYHQVRKAVSVDHGRKLRRYQVR